MPLNDKQKALLDQLLHTHFGDLNTKFQSLEPSIAVNALRAIMKTSILNDNRKLFERENVIDSILLFRSIFQHPNPQNVATSAKYKVLYNDDMVVYRNERGDLCEEMKGILGLTELHNGSTELVTKHDLCSYLASYVENELYRLEQISMNNSGVSNSGVGATGSNPATGVSPRCTLSQPTTSVLIQANQFTFAPDLFAHYNQFESIVNSLSLQDQLTAKREFYELCESDDIGSTDSDASSSNQFRRDVISFCYCRVAWFSTTNKQAIISELTKILQYTQCPKLLTIVHFFRGFCENEVQQFDQAVNDFSIVLETDVHFISAYNNRGFSYKKLNRLPEAVNDLTKVIEMTPQCASAYCNRGVVNEAMENWEDALSDYTMAMQIEPNNAIAIFNRGLVHSHGHNYGAALVDLEKACSIDPGNQLFQEHRRQVLQMLSQ